MTRRVETDADWAAARAIRQRVFVEEQACPEDEEWDAFDWPEDRGRTCRHLLLEAGGVAVGTARWRPVDGVAKLERFAVVPEARGRGLGGRLVEAAMADARAAGYERMAMHAQAHLQAWYERYGFEAEGPVFAEAGIDHVKMAWPARRGA